MKTYYILALLTAVLFAGCRSNQTSATGPSNVLRQYVAASQKKDTSTMKNLLSKSSLEYIEKNAKMRNRTVDDILLDEASMRKEDIEYALEMRNEKIEGDTATVEIKNEMTGEFDMTMPFVKENGAWKLARDKYVGEMLEKTN
jgi:hypothetical protein